MNKYGLKKQVKGIKTMRFYNTRDKCFLELIFGPKWKYIATVRAFLQSFLTVSLKRGLAKAEIISMAVSELLENSIKYGTESGIKVFVELAETEDRIIVSVENFSSKESIAELLKEVKRVKSGPADKIYLEKMQEAAMRTDGGSQLGLARIRHEANAEISVTVTDDLVAVTTEFTLD